jgi:ATP-dependent RNA helicase DDX56/DBP9
MLSIYNCPHLLLVSDLKPIAPLLQEFNRGLFDYLIATDDIHGGNGDDQEDEGRSKRQRKGSGGGGGGGKRQRKDEEFGVTRGIDFKGVRTVVNFEAPSSTQG